MDPSAFDPSPNVEDRRDEWSAWQKLLMAAGVPPVDNTDNAKMGLRSGSGQWVDEPWDPLPAPPSPLGKEAGIGDIPSPELKQFVDASPPRKIPIWEDMGSRYNTPLTPAEQPAFEAWAKAGGKDAGREMQDYDLQGYYKKSGGAPLAEGHLTDEFKKPNHPTFSNESRYHGQGGNDGGVWQQGQDGNYTFAPGKTNLEQWGPQALQEYFNKYEPKNKVMFSPEGRDGY